MIWSVILWYLLAVGLGLLVFPLAYRLFPGLTDRGYSVSRALGLLLWGYLFWVLSSYGLLVNNVGGYLLALLLVLALVYWGLRAHPLSEITAWLKDHRGYLLAVELVFLLAFVFMAAMRAMEPELLTTEKPMELAFINAIMRSESMPPHDPWLADYSISYYYFGYVIVAMLAKITGVTAGLAFNLGITLVFALSAVGAYGIVYNLLAVFNPGKRLHRAFQALRGPVFVLLVSNLEGFLEYLYAKRYFWVNGESRFWTWLNILNLNTPPSETISVGNLRYWWWWRASRVVYDASIFDGHQEVIDEFPFFSYFLADLHPHVLGMPFIFLAMALALNIFLDRREVERPFWVWTLKFDFDSDRFVRVQRTYFDFSLTTFLFSAVLLGGLAFLNIWDWPWYVGLFSASYVLRRAQGHGWGWGRLWEFIGLGLLLGLAGGLAYLPYYIGFSSQAGGVLPNIINPTRGVHLWVMFGVFFIPLFIFLVHLLRQKKDARSLGASLTWTLGGTLLLFAASILPVLVLGWLAKSGLPSAQAGIDFLNNYGGVSLQELLQVSLSRRGAAIFGLVTLVALIAMAAAVLWPRHDSEEQEFEIEKTDSKPVGLPSSHLFAALLIVFGGLLVIIPEFIFLRDLFNHRMNTIFKFYYQAWLLWGVAAAYGSAVLLNKVNLKSTLYTILLAALLIMGLTYPLMAVHTRVTSFQDRSDQQFNLDGTAGSYYSHLTADEKAGVLWLQEMPLGTLVEAVGGSYSGYARISSNSGQPALLGWPWHETQWRGSSAPAGSRESDIARLYTTSSWPEADQIIRQYGITYIVVGSLERSTYQVQEDKFMRYLTPVFQSGTFTIYQTSISAP